MKKPELARNESTAAALVVADLRKSFRQGFLGRRGKPAVDGLGFTVQRGEIFALLGHNGAGKTTTLKSILGLVHPDEGTISIGGLDAGDPRSRARVGYLPESPYFHENLTCAELLDFYSRLLGLDSAQRRKQRQVCLEMVDMQDHADRRLGQCSKGMRQRIGLAQALLGQPELLILDEPQSGLDPLGRRLVREILLEQKRRGTTVVFSSHIVPDVELVADRVAMIRHGKLDEIKDLREAGTKRLFSATVSAPDEGSPLDIALKNPSLTVTHRRPERWTVMAADPASLAELLTACTASGCAVHDVQTAGGDLESEFLAGLESASTNTPKVEVVS